MVATGQAHSFGVAVRTKREQLRLTQAQLAIRAGVSRSQISELEAGRIRQPRAEAFTRICRALGISGAAFLGADIAFAEGLSQVDAEELYFLATSLLQLASRDPTWLRERLAELRDLLVMRQKEQLGARRQRRRRP